MTDAFMYSMVEEHHHGREIGIEAGSAVIVDLEDDAWGEPLATNDVLRRDDDLRVLGEHETCVGFFGDRRGTSTITAANDVGAVFVVTVTVF